MEDKDNFQDAMDEVHSSSMSGYDVCFMPVGKFDKLYCKICGEEMNVIRNTEGYTSSASVMAKKKTKHDYFSCKYFEKKWHYKAYRILRELEGTSSDSLKKLLGKDLEELINGDRGK